MEPSSSENLGYKDEYLEKLAQQVRDGVKEMSKLKEKADKIRDINKSNIETKEYEEIMNMSNKITKISNNLAVYLAQTYPNKFKLIRESSLASYFGTIEVKENKTWKLSELDDPDILKIWEVIPDKKTIHNLYYVDITQIMEDNQGPRKIKYDEKCIFVFFIAEDDVYIQTNNRFELICPDPFYDFLERLGLISGFQDYIYRGPKIVYKDNKWPRKVNKEKL